MLISSAEDAGFTSPRRLAPDTLSKSDAKVTAAVSALSAPRVAREVFFPDATDTPGAGSTPAG
jgi:hypothetical protein